MGSEESEETEREEEDTMMGWAWRKDSNNGMDGENTKMRNTDKY